ncbi:TetR/AcrR family transcriptional regulator [Streptomyces sp. N2-109]|uniref:TetR/AcrR family transcriptional regulator n=1 Tax=Streptomyces gossypii TaxID=2883101 RepID=A0ABT2JYW0_9ACTN|nr:TetR/AcrR family transcriptional regulator [Streptomyces gossypii]MCT2593075.1 TetR/AcrR family transcriptional regulator [Streptomyces gossypii]
MPTHARERLLETAKELFFAEGIRAVGVEALLSSSGVGRASFYRHFDSKDELVGEVLKERDRSWRDWLAGAVADRGGTPLDVFDALAEDGTRGGFRGCAFINAGAEFADAGSPVHALALAHKRAVTEFVAVLLRDAGYRECDALAEQFMLLMDGATVTAARERSAEPMRRARAIAAKLLA